MSPEAKLSPPPTRSRISISRWGTWTVLIKRDGTLGIAAGGEQSVGDELQVRISGRYFAQHLLVAGDEEFGEVLTDAFDFTPSMAEKPPSLPRNRSTLQASSRFASWALALPPMDFQRGGGS
jgi:hypothetical protein